MRSERIPVAGPWITTREVEFVARAAADGWYNCANIYQERFESAFASYVGRRFAVALPSCTSAIHLALLALGIGPGDEVIVPEITWIATAAPVSYVGATPVFADIEPRSWCLAVDAFERVITPKTKAVIPVDLYGGMPDLDAISQIAADRGIAIVEDAAEAIGSEYRGRKAGSFGVCSVFSFHGSKTLTTGEGGMLLTDSEELYKRALVLRDHGRRAGDPAFWNVEIAYKYRMSALQAALGLAQLERVEELVARKREIFGWYSDLLQHCDWVTLNDESPALKNSYWMVTAILDSRLGLKKEAIMAALDRVGIDSRPFFYPLSSLPAYRDRSDVENCRYANVVAYSISPYGLNLPSGLNLTREHAVYVCRALRDVQVTLGL